MSGSQRPQTQKGSSKTREGPPETQEGSAQTQQDPTEAQEGFTETQEGPVETQEGPAETQEGLIQTQECPVESQQDSTETQEGFTESQEGLTETQEGFTVSQEGLTETQEGAAEEMDPSGLSTNTNHRGDHQRLECSVVSPSSLQPPDKPFLTEQQESFQAEQAEGEKPPSGPDQTGQDQLPTEENLQESSPTIQADLGGSTVPKPDQEDPGRHEQTLKDIGQGGRSVEPPSVCSTGEPKLCGFLMKRGGPLKAWKLRWFTYEDQQNQLFYYRTPQDVTPLGRIELCSTTFTYPLKAETGTFHITTPERTFVLKAVTQELMLYWLQQLQVKRWRHRRTTIHPRLPNHHPADEFLPLLKSPVGLVGEKAANVLSQRTPLANVSLKHPLIEIQNSVHSLRKRVSQECQSVFYVEAPTDTINITRSWSLETSSAALPLAQPPSQESLLDTREPSSFFNSWSRRKNRSPSTQVSREPLSLDQVCRLQQDNQMLTEEVKAQKELVWILHKALEASQLEKRACDEFLAEKGEQERLEVLRHRERQAAGLQEQLEETKMEAEALRRSLAQRNTQLEDLEEQIKMWMEKNDAKQEVILKLSDQVTIWMGDQQLDHSNQTCRQLQQQMDNLRDDIEAYKTQNQFLNSEIYQLTRLWRTSSEQERSLMTKAAYLEARNCQVESRYLEVLRQLQDTKSLDASQQEALQKLVEDALKRELQVKHQVTSDYDDYGFKMFPDYEVEDMKLLAKIQALEIRSNNLLQQEGVDRPMLERWGNYLAARSDHDLRASPELKSLLRGGVPQEYRRRLWRWMVHVRTRTIREHDPDYYQQLCEKSGTSPHPASRQIELDLHRTLTTNQLFCSPSSPALQQLRRILLAFSWRNPAIGYCQGLNRLAAVALLVLQSEEDAFWCLVAIVETIMPQDYFTKNLVASQADQRVLKDFLSEKLPRISSHFVSHSVDVSLITFNWFLVVFVESLPSDILLLLWDAFLYEGTKVIFRYALALFKYKEDDILKIHSGVELYHYLRFFTKTITDTRKLSNIAFGDMNPFPRRLLRNRRALHLEHLQRELQQLAEQQEEFLTEHAERKDKDLDMAASEDDDEL